MGTFDKMAENYAKLTGKWAKMNDSGFEEFEAKNPGLATGKPGHNTDNIKIEYKMAENGFQVSFSVDDAEAKTVNYAINGRVNKLMASRSLSLQLLSLKVAACPAVQSQLTTRLRLVLNRKTTSSMARIE